VNIHLIAHPRYSQDVSPSGFPLFGIFQEKLKNYSARTSDELKQEVDSILRSVPEAERISVFQVWRRRFQQVIDSGGEYI
jgi:hypothetical protein